MAEKYIQFILTGGSLDDVLHITVRAETSLGNVVEKDVIVTIEDILLGSFEKDPEEETVFAIDLEEDVESVSGDTLASAVITVTDQNGDSATSECYKEYEISGDQVLVSVQAGTAGWSYTVKCVATTTLGFIYSRTVGMIIVER